MSTSSVRRALAIVPISLALGLAVLTAPAQAADTVVVPPQVPADPTTPITFFVGLPYDGAGVERAARSVSDPNDSQFRRFLKGTEVAQRFGATARAGESLVSAARAAGLNAKVDASRFFARVTGTVATWEKLMGAPVQYVSAETEAFWGQPTNDVYSFAKEPLVAVVAGVPVPAVTSTTDYLPAPKALAKAITWFLPEYAQYAPDADTAAPSPGAAFARHVDPLGYVDIDTPATPQPLPPNAGTPLGTSCIATDGVAIQGLNGATDQSAFFTPDQVSQAYGLQRLQHSYGAKESGEVAIISLNGGFLASDLQNSANCFGYHAPKVDVRRGTGVGSAFVNVDGETSLDLQTVAWTLKNANAIRLVEATNGATAFLDGYANALSDPKGPPAAISLSYGACESSYAKQPGWRTTEALFQTAALVGTSLFVASGDTGSSTCQVGDLLGVLQIVIAISEHLGEDNIPAETLDYLRDVLGQVLAAAAAPDPTVSYPAVSPWVTSVGATQLTLGKSNAIDSQTVWNDLQYGLQGNAVSTGGTSSSFSAPWYQRPLTSLNGRAVPDVSALGAASPGMALSVHGEFSVVAGTSQASPLMAAAMTLVGHAGADRLGFVNPWLYGLAAAHASTFMDVTRGDNQYPLKFNATTVNAPACCQAQPGFDAASGLGTPVFSKLAD